MFLVIFPHAQCEWDKVINVGVYIIRECGRTLYVGLAHHLYTIYQFP